jgi:hypothetical protein
VKNDTIKLSMRAWAELDAVAWFMQGEQARLFGHATHCGAIPEHAELKQIGLIRFTSKHRMRVTRKGFAALATKSKRFLARAGKIAQRDYAADWIE